MPDLPPVPTGAPVADETPGPDQRLAQPGAGDQPAHEDRTAQLYRSALGSLNIAQYQAVFQRYDAAGRRSLVWHPAAAAFTLGWLVFRRLWLEALVYVTVLLVVLIAAALAWPTVQSWPSGVRWGAVGALMLVGVVVPGLTGYVLVHRQVQRRLLRVVAAARSLDEAQAVLLQQAATPNRLWFASAIQVALLLAIWLGLGKGVQPLVPVQPLAAPPDVAGSDEVVQSAVPQPSLVEPTVDAAAAKTLEAAYGDEPDVGGDTASFVSVAPTPVAAAVALQPEVVGAEQTTEPPIATLAPAQAPLQALPAEAPKTAENTGYGINVGLFADESNARRVEARLHEAGLQVELQTLSTPRGPLTRVRVGPYQQRAAADEVAEGIRALGLEAVVFSR